MSQASENYTNRYSKLEININHKGFYLVPVSLDHLDDIFSLYNDQELCVFYGIKPHESKTQTQKLIEFWHKQFEKCSGAHFAIKNKDTEKVIGTIGFNRLIKGVSAEIGFGLLSQYKNQGIISFAVKETLRYGFSYFNLNRIEAQTDPENIGCIKVLEKNNFKKEGHLREHFFALGKFHDTLIYSTLKKENLL